MLSIPFDEYIDLDGQSLRVRRSRASGRRATAGRRRPDALFVCI